MAKYLYKLRYTKQGVDGTIREGFSSREAFFRKTVEDLGGTAEAVYWAYGPDDAIAVVDMPKPEAATALSLALGSTGSFGVTTTVLLTAAEMDAAVQVMPSYRAPGA